MTCESIGGARATARCLFLLCIYFVYCRFENSEAYLENIPDACRIVNKRIKGVERRVVVCVEAKDVYRPAFMKR